MNIDIPGVNAQTCGTDYGDYVVDFYPRDHRRHKVRKEIHDSGYKIAHKETAEGGELVTWFLEPATD